MEPGLRVCSCSKACKHTCRTPKLFYPQFLFALQLIAVKRRTGFQVGAVTSHNMVVVCTPIVFTEQCAWVFTDSQLLICVRVPKHRDEGDMACHTQATCKCLWFQVGALASLGRRGVVGERQKANDHIVHNYNLSFNSAPEYERFDHPKTWESRG